MKKDTDKEEGLESEELRSTAQIASPGGNAQELYSRTTHDIRVTVTPTFLEERANTGENVFAYAYHVHITNLGSRIVKLLNRHWIIRSGGQQIADVKGEGVVGEQPTLHPGDSHSYSSWTVVRDPVGSMLGTYTFAAEDGEFFDVEIPEFHLIFLDESHIH